MEISDYLPMNPENGACNHDPQILKAPLAGLGICLSADFVLNLSVIST
jgi:hypothetical protein